MSRRDPNNWNLDDDYVGDAYQPDVSYEEEEAMRDEVLPYDSDGSGDDDRNNPYIFLGEY